jgi:CheY-like chemotaxis protein
MSEKIVIVEDSRAIRKIFAALLENEGYQVRQAQDGDELSAILKEFHPDLILMDFNLPGTGGLDLTRMLKAVETTRDIAVVAVTSCTLSSDVEKAAEAGCEGFIAKPINRANFVPRVKAYLKRRKLPGVEPSAV